VPPDGVTLTPVQLKAIAHDKLRRFTVREEIATPTYRLYHQLVVRSRCEGVRFRLFRPTGPDPELPFRNAEQAGWQTYISYSVPPSQGRR